jgi:hypothetical protein
VLGQRARITLGAELAEQPRRTLDVREKKGNGTGRKIAHEQIMRNHADHGRKSRTADAWWTTRQRLRPGPGTGEGVVCLANRKRGAGTRRVATRRRSSTPEVRTKRPTKWRKKANRFAANQLIPRQREGRLASLHTDAEVKSFARHIGIAPGSSSAGYRKKSSGRGTAAIT